MLSKRKLFLGNANPLAIYMYAQVFDDVFRASWQVESSSFDVEGFPFSKYGHPGQR